MTFLHVPDPTKPPHRCTPPDRWDNDRDVAAKVVPGAIWRCDECGNKYIYKVPLLDQLLNEFPGKKWVPLSRRKARQWERAYRSIR